jgi:hypothetical protein
VITEKNKTSLAEVAARGPGQLNARVEDMEEEKETAEQATP